MRRRCAEVAVFVCVFGLFLGYCEWWEHRSCEPAAPVSPHPEIYAAIIVSDAGDDSFNGVYEPLFQADGTCYFKSDPDRFLWCDGRRWHLGTEPGRLADGYMGVDGSSDRARWCLDGASAPAPEVCFIPASDDFEMTETVSGPVTWASASAPIAGGDGRK